MIKWLVVIGVVGFIYFYFIKKKPAKIKTQQDKNTKKETSQVNEMVECCICGTYCEVNEMILSGSKYYCSQECLEKA